MQRGLSAIAEHRVIFLSASYMLCVNVLRTWPVSCGAYAPWVLPVTLYHGLFTCCFACDVCVCVWRINLIA